MLQAVPLEEDLPGLDVHFLGYAVPRHATLRATDRGEVRGRRLVGRQERGVLGCDHKLVQVAFEAIARADPCYLCVRVVEDHVLADAVPRDDPALPPGEHGPALVVLRLEVPRGRVLGEPHEPPSVVEDHRSMLPCALL